MNAIWEKHKALIEGLTKFYQCLITMRYFSAEQVIFARPDQCLAVDVNRLQSMGFDPEVIELVQYLPTIPAGLAYGWLDDGAEIAPMSYPSNYLSDHDDIDEDMFKNIRVGDFGPRGDVERVLDPWMLRLTDGRGSGNHGYNLIYNVRDQTAKEWIGHGGKTLDELPAQPVSTVLSEWLRRLESLEWVPDYDPVKEETHRWRIKNGPAAAINMWDPNQAAHVPDDLKEAVAIVPMMRRDANEFIALQELYWSCGWKSEAGFNAAEFEAGRKHFCEERERLDLADEAEALNRFLAESAGSRAV